MLHYIRIAAGALSLLVGVSVAIAGDTGTPFPEDTKVEVKTATTTVIGVLKASSTKDWIMLAVDGEKEPRAIKLSDETQLRKLVETKEATVRYWEAAVNVMNELYATKDDRGFWGGKPIGAYLDMKPPETDFPWMSGNKLKEFADKLKELDATEAHSDAIDAVTKLTALLQFGATRRGHALATALEAGSAQDPSGVIAEAGEKATTFVDLRDPTSQRIKTVQAKLSKLYDVKLAELKCPKKPDDETKP